MSDHAQPTATSTTTSARSVRRARSRWPASVAALGVLLLAAGPAASAPGGQGAGEAPPRVYTVENSGAALRAPELPPFAALPVTAGLPDPFVPLLGGARDTSFTSWEQRRTEVMASIQHYEIGQRPAADEVEVDAVYVPGQLTVTITRPSTGGSLVLTSGVRLPLGDGPFPAVVTMEPAPGAVRGRTPNTGPQGLGIPDSFWEARGVARIDFPHDQLTTWVAGAGVPHRYDPYYRLFPEQYPPGETGQYSAWSWGVSRLLDGIEIARTQAPLPLPVETTRMAVTGCSYAGKMALFAGAFDERIALTIPQESGGGGIPAWRVSHGIEANGSVEKIDNTNYNWFRTSMRQFSGDGVQRLPHDHHQLMGLVAPRALLVTGNTDMMWLSNRSGYASARAAERVYETFGIPDRFGYSFTRGYAHCVVPPDLQATIGTFVDAFLLDRPAPTAAVRTRPQEYDDPASPLHVDWARWQEGWGRP